MRGILALSVWVSVSAFAVDLGPLGLPEVTGYFLDGPKGRHGFNLLPSKNAQCTSSPISGYETAYRCQVPGAELRMRYGDAFPGKFEFTRMVAFHNAKTAFVRYHFFGNYEEDRGDMVLTSPFELSIYRGGQVKNIQGTISLTDFRMNVGLQGKIEGVPISTHVPRP